MLRRFAAALSLMFITSLGVAASPASADTAWACAKGDVCFYYDKAATRLACSTDSDGSPCNTSGIWAIYNNGWVEPGYDHAYLSIHIPSNGANSLGCIHQGHKGALGTAIQVNKVTWGRECGTGMGEQWQL